MSSASFSVTQVQQQIQNAILPINTSQQISLNAGLNRTLASDIIATMNVPAFDNSAMDGYAFCSQDLAVHPELAVVGQSYAGHPFRDQLQPGQAIRITTGAAMPNHADSVLPQEFAVLKDASTLAMRNIVIQAGQNRRLCGEDIALGSTVVSKGRRLGPAELGLLASLGLSTISVQRQLRIAIFSTGDELRSIDQTLDSGSVYDSNRVTLHAMLSQFGAEVLDLGVLADNPTTIETALKNIVDKADVIITSGGISAGAADFTKQVMQQLGHMNFWAINMRPGRPLAFGIINKNQLSDPTYVFGLPGNPVAMMVSFYFFVRPALQLLSGSNISMTPTINAISTEAIVKKAGRTEFQRGICAVDAMGELRVGITGEQGSAMLSSMTRANCLIVLNPEQGNIVAGDKVQVMLFDGLI
jgi:molybdopterin molybdotransferase